MNKIPKYWNTAKKYLSNKDKVMKLLINKYSVPSETILTKRKDVFYSLCKSIIGQQISVAAANSVFLKFKKKCKNKINAKNINKLKFIQLKSCGLSKQKVKGIKSLAKQILNKTFNPKLISKMSDEEAILYLSELRHIGLLRAISKNYKKRYLPPATFINLLHNRFSPYCSVATWYLWRSIDPEPIKY